jgi:hypothetical protein
MGFLPVLLKFSIDEQSNEKMSLNFSNERRTLLTVYFLMVCCKIFGTEVKRNYYEAGVLYQLRKERRVFYGWGVLIRGEV